MRQEKAKEKRRAAELLASAGGDGEAGQEGCQRCLVCWLCSFAAAACHAEAGWGVHLTQQALHPA